MIAQQAYRVNTFPDSDRSLQLPINRIDFQLTTLSDSRCEAIKHEKTRPSFCLTPQEQLFLECLAQDEEIEKISSALQQIQDPAFCFELNKQNNEEEKCADEEICADSQHSRNKELIEGGEEEEKHEYHAESEQVQKSHGLIRCLLRQASRNLYNGEGIEVTEWDKEAEEEHHSEIEHVRTRHMLEAADYHDNSCLQRSESFDESQSSERETIKDVSFSGSIRRNKSENELISLLMEQNRLKESASDSVTASPAPTNEGDEDDFFDPWTLQKFTNDHGNGDAPLMILGTSADDRDSFPHVLSPPLMESLRSAVPFSNSSDNFWMKYSLVRDGASMHTFLERARGATNSILAIETTDGEVFGAFTTSPWRRTWNCFGRGQSFLWKLKNSRSKRYSSILEAAWMEGEVNVFPYSGDNDCIQICNSKQIAVGGGAHHDATSKEEKDGISQHEWGHGLCIQNDMTHGTTSPCVTFNSPSLSRVHADGSTFEIVNLELWSLTPCMNVKDAESLEKSRLLLEKN